MDFVFLAFTVASAFCWAMLEIQIEGPHGWAAKLPTWRLNNPLVRWIYGPAGLTGYHVWAFLSTMLFFHAPFLWAPWSVRLELRVLGAYLLFWLIEDFLWFLLNPHFGLRKFRPEIAVWHGRWFLGFPLLYWIALTA